MSFSSIGFLFEEAAKSVRRNGVMSFAALAVVTMAMAVFGGALFTVYRLHQIADAQPRQFEVEVFLKPDVGRETALEVKSRVEKYPGVVRVTLYPRESALAEILDSDSKKGTDIGAALNGENPLPDRLDVRLNDPSMTRQFSTVLRDEAQYPEVESVREAQDDLDKVMAAARLVRNVGGGIAVALLLATAFVIQNTIRLTVHARRKEIRVMQLVGATPGFIRTPMVLEGIFYGVAGAAIAAGIVYLIVRQISVYGSKLMSPLMVQGLPASASPWLGLAVLTGAGAALGLVGTWLSLRRFLRRA
jgi:cell division transport system permease protein